MPPPTNPELFVFWPPYFDIKEERTDAERNRLNSFLRENIMKRLYEAFPTSTVPGQTVSIHFKMRGRSVDVRCKLPRPDRAREMRMAQRAKEIVAQVFKDAAALLKSQDVPAPSPESDLPS